MENQQTSTTSWFDTKHFFNFLGHLHEITFKLIITEHYDKLFDTLETEYLMIKPYILKLEEKEQSEKEIKEIDELFKRYENILENNHEKKDFRKISRSIRNKLYYFETKYNMNIPIKELDYKAPLTIKDDN